MVTEEYTLDELKEKIKDATIKFYSGQKTGMSDVEYDSMVKLIQTKEPDFDYHQYIKFVEDGVYADHEISFREFEKYNEIDGISSESLFNELKDKYVILPKFDGSSIVIYLDTFGKVDKIVTRSDESCGVVQTKKLKGIVEKLIEGTNTEGIKAILAEAVVSKANGGRPQANGLINSKYLQSDVEEKLRIMPFDIYKVDGTKSPYLPNEISDYGVFSLLRDKGEFEYNGEVIPCDGIVCYPRSGEEKLYINKLYYDRIYNGIVEEICHWPSESYGIFHPTVKVKITDSDSDYEYINPSGHNYNWLKSNFKYPVTVGSKVEVIFANLTIPEIKDVVEPCEHNDKVFCPDCGKELEWINNDLICSNELCSWWIKLIKYRLAGLIKPEVIDLPDIMYSEDVNNYDTLISILNKEKAKSILEEDLYTYMYLLCIPRVSDNKIEKLSELRKEYNNHYDCLYNNLTDTQWTYYEFVHPKVDYLLNRIINY